MPVTISAKKALRRDKRRANTNKNLRAKVRKAVKSARLANTGESLKKAMSALDKAAKRNILHKKKADRLKSRLAKKVKAPKKKSTNAKK